MIDSNERVSPSLALPFAPISQDPSYVFSPRALLSPASSHRALETTPLIPSRDALASIDMPTKLELVTT